MRPYLDLLRREKGFRRAYLALAGSKAVFGLGGLLSDVVPARDLLAASGGVVLLYAGCWWLATRRLRTPAPPLMTAEER